MAISFSTKLVDGFDRELRLVSDNYVARPVTVNKDTISGLQPNEKGRYIIPQGTLLGGNGVTLLDNPQQIAKAATFTYAGSATAVGAYIEVSSKNVTGGSPSVEIRKSTADEQNQLAVTSTDSGTIVVIVRTDKNNDITTTAKEVVDAINSHNEANTFVSAALVSTATKKDVVAEVSAVSIGASTATLSGDVDGILLHSTDVTDGEATGALVINGVVNADVFPAGIDAIRTALPKITFARID